MLFKNKTFQHAPTLSKTTVYTSIHRCARCMRVTTGLLQHPPLLPCHLSQGRVWRSKTTRGTAFQNTSAELVSVFVCCVFTTRFLTSSFKNWRGISTCYVFAVDVCVSAMRTVPWLSQKTKGGMHSISISSTMFWIQSTSLGQAASAMNSALQLLQHTDNWSLDLYIIMFPLRNVK